MTWSARRTPNRDRQRRLALWAGIAIDDAWGLEWNMLLVPEIVDPALRLDNDAVQVYQRLTWVESVQGESVEVTAARRWVRTRRTGAEHGLIVHATVDGRVVAESLLAIIDATAASPMGTSGVPSAPSGSARGEIYEGALTDADVWLFAEASGAHYAIHEDQASARRAGLGGTIVQSTLLFGLLARSGYGLKPSTVEMWFRAPVLTGSVVSVRCLADVDGEAVVEMSTGGGQGRSAVIARISSPTLS